MAEWTYSKYADEFVRQVCREYAGWRRDEWAYSPLFIWVEIPSENPRGARRQRATEPMHLRLQVAVF